MKKSLAIMLSVLLFVMVFFSYDFVTVSYTHLTLPTMAVV